MPAAIGILLTFLLFNLINSSPWRLDEFQSYVYMLVGFAAFVKGAEKWFGPIKTRTPPRKEIHYVERVADSYYDPPTIPDYGTPSGPPNPNQGKPEHNNYGV